MTGRAPIPVGEFNGMQRVTPTGLAEARYAARGVKMAVGPAGVPVPGDRIAFRPTVDIPLLTRIGAAAVDLHSSRQISDAEIAVAARAVTDDLLQRYPADEMLVLEKWGEAWPHQHAMITLPANLNYRFQLAEQVIVPRGRASTYAPNGERNNLPLPASTAYFFQRVNDVEEVRSAVKHRLHAWTASFKGNAGRAPRWGEIADAWPVIADWFADQRRAA